MLQINNLTIESDSHRLLSIPSLEFYQGQITAIIGESGSGKTLTFRALTRISAPELKVSGEIKYDGLDIYTLSAEDLLKFRRDEWFVIFQDAYNSFSPSTKMGLQLYNFSEPYEQVSYEEFAREITPILESLELSADNLNQYPFQFSGGMLQRAMLAAGIYKQSPWLIADEPTSGVDIETQATFLEILQRVQQDYQQSTILITHDIDVVKAVADRVIVMYQGEVVEVGDKEIIFNNPQHEYTKELLLSSFEKWEKYDG